MKLWDKGFTINDKIEKFTVGKDRELDAHLAKYDALASKAQANMLAKTGLITNEENDALQIALDEVLVLIAENNFEVDENYEDIHSKIEAFLIEKTGDAGKKIHVARSRNDQVLVAIQLFEKEYLKHTTEKIVNLIEIFLQKADEFKNHQLPGYTHFQAAMPSSFGMWFSAYAESLLTDLYFFEAAYKISDQNPLGSGAGFGTSFPIDRLQTTQELGFSEILVSSVGAQMLRGKTEKSVATALAMICGTLSKMSYDLVLYNSQDLAFVKLPNEMTTGSSIMPHKKNPDVFELTRAHCNRIQALPNDIMMTINNLPSGYHRDYQILKEILFEPMMQFDNIIDILTFAIPQLQIKDNYMNQDKYDPIYTVENINEAIKNGTPFRDAYREVGLSVENGTYVPHKEFQTSHIGSIHNLRLDLISNKIEKFKLEAQVLK
ncbi:argininosuccinate lyase [Empedobacter falsenii]|uniref:Argininosuccinate lyase n=1 Tax=Empedobacter falsenii TaxID=343874 RepID=A0A376G390_9FLAO|nr:argininosuccinate lyase [Empedobacter falsenii]HCC95247.1 argininosuccinate lyase [Flavobacteriaceae bacterium]MDM1063111.1 argininosuccinate lyase [Empedobacter falsenii]MDM1547941.1 argininosuccinate lyase [Empedobacter falsenii]MDM1552363.1 argininosuccinate lyase [Empedobacter falsenii]STD53136.1 Argininosuccinate lyase [Empedobacter falsenii]